MKSGRKKGLFRAAVPFELSGIRKVVGLGYELITAENKPANNGRRLLLHDMASGVGLLCAGSQESPMTDPRDEIVIPGKHSDAVRKIGDDLRKGTLLPRAYKIAFSINAISGVLQSSFLP
ncbi:MAG: hypothetical protein JW884_00755 [Deltaproteobacteria bacterium]|nr:hypothetical protein [Deltaproteobacteria bacterium]